ncbi:MAG: UDP-N-acetylmuramate dehydrogenase [Candidatus Cloacimonetes bacterium]|nr:UDP-N-acetylmuramate dehydrogenase [Candidatus Cloacimonadota bacterium]
MFDSKMLTSFHIKSSLSEYSNIKIGGKASYLLAPLSFRSLSQIIKEANKGDLEILPLGGGSNILFGNVGDRVIILDAFLPELFQVNSDVVTVSANCKISTLIDRAMTLGLGGLEFISGIPAHVGGAVNMNAGAFGKSLFDYLSWIEYIDHNGELKKKTHKELDHGYRITSIDGFITKAAFKLQKKKQADILAEKETIINKRSTRHPYDFPSLGSTFKNPEGHYAGRLIEDCQLKGTQIGGAQISEKHANFIINKENATFDDVMSLIRLAKKKVKERKNINLELEIKVIND